MKYIITADWHIRKDCPRCRLIDNWMDYQFNIIENIFKITKEHEADLILAGDIFHTPNPSNDVVIRTIDVFQEQTFDTCCLFIPGNHDLPYNNINNENRAAIGVLCRSLNSKYTPVLKLQDIHIIHELVLEKEKMFGKGKTASEVLQELNYPKYVITGDNHHSFVYKEKGSVLINPGCIIRQASDMADYQPKVFLLDTDTNEITEIPINDDGKFVTDSYLKTEQERKSRIESFITTIQKNNGVSLNFIDNLKQNMAGVEKSVCDVLDNIISEI